MPGFGMLDGLLRRQDETDGGLGTATGSGLVKHNNLALHANNLLN